MPQPEGGHKTSGSGMLGVFVFSPRRNRSGVCFNGALAIPRPEVTGGSKYSKEGAAMKPKPKTSDNSLPRQDPPRPLALKPPAGGATGGIAATSPPAAPTACAAVAANKYPRVLEMLRRAFAEEFEEARFSMVCGVKPREASDKLLDWVLRRM